MPSSGDRGSGDKLVGIAAQPGKQTSLGRRVFHARVSVELTAFQFAMQLRINEQDVKDLENDRSQPEADLLQRISDLLNVSAKWLLTGTGPGPDTGSRREGFSDAGAVTAEKYAGMSEDRKPFSNDDVSDIMRKIGHWTASDEETLSWYRSFPLVAFGSCTAEDLVKQGKADALREYLDFIESGGFQ